MSELFKVTLLGYIIGSVMVSDHSMAQLDPSSAVLVRPSGRTPDPEELNPNRYTVKPPSKNSRPPNSVSTPISPSASPQRPADEPQKVSAPSDVSGPDRQQKGEQKDKETQAKEPSDSPSQKSSLGEVVWGGSPDQIHNYQSRLHDDDRRHNIIEVSFAPAYLSNTAQSNYTFRNYTSNGPGFMVGADVWLTPFFGIHTDMVSTLRADMIGVYGGQDRIHSEHQMFRAGLRGRRYFGFARMARSLTYGLDYFEYQLKVPPDAAQRVGLKSSGVSINIGAQIPRSPSFVWNFGASFAPSASHQELPTGISLSSGGDRQTTALGVWLGGEHVLSRRNTIFWNLDYRLERNFFLGGASAADPATSSVPNGVVVQNNFYLFSLGLRWGN